MACHGDCGESKDKVWSIFCELKMAMSKANMTWTSDQAELIISAMREAMEAGKASVSKTKYPVEVDVAEPGVGSCGVQTGRASSRPPRDTDSCQTCKKRQGTRRVHHGLPAGTHCDPCWAELLEDYRKA